MDRCGCRRQPRDRLSGRALARASDPRPRARRPPITAPSPSCRARPDAAFIAVPNHEVPDVAGALARTRRRRLRMLHGRLLRDRQPSRGERSTRELVEQRRRPALLRPELLRLRQFLRSSGDDARSGRRRRLDRGVALICQSGTIALTLMFNDRSLPIGCLFTVGNQTRLAVEDLIETSVRRSARHGIRTVSRRDQGRGEHLPAPRSGREPPASRSPW